MKSITSLGKPIILKNACFIRQYGIYRKGCIIVDLGGKACQINNKLSLSRIYVYQEIGSERRKYATVRSRPSPKPTTGSQPSNC